MTRKQIDIQRKFRKKTILANKEATIKAIKREDCTIFIDQETHWENGESEIIYRMLITNNFN